MTIIQTLTLICAIPFAEWAVVQVLEHLDSTTDLPSVVYVGEGIAQFVFFRGERPSVTYATREGGPGKYQGQQSVTLARV